MPIVIGIDPGLSGGVAALRVEGGRVSVAGLLTMRQATDCLSVVLDTASAVYMEQGSAVIRTPRGAQRAPYAYAHSVGWLEGFAVAKGKPAVVVPPVRWQKHCYLPGEGEGKGRSFAAVSRLFPGQSLLASARCSVPHDGMADALLIAWYGVHHGGLLHSMVS